MMFLYLLLTCIPIAMGQLFLGPCPYPPPDSVKDLNLNKYSGDWYVVAQSDAHHLKAADCERVKYKAHDNGLVANFSFFDSQRHTMKHVGGKLRTDRYSKNPGELNLLFDNFPRVLQFRVLHTNYSDVAVEYACMSGVMKNSLQITVLHRRKPTNDRALNETLQQLNVSSYVDPKFRKTMKLVDHTKC